MAGEDDRLGRAAIERWHGFVLDRVLLFCFGILAVAAAVTYKDEGLQHSVVLYSVLPSLLLIACAIFWPSAPKRFRQAAFIVGMMSVVVGAGLRGAYLVPNAFTGHLLLTVLVALFMGRRTAWIVWAVGTLCWVAIAAHFVGGPTPLGEPAFDTSLVSNWVRVLSTYAAVSAVALASVGYLSERTAGAVVRGEALYQALTKESSERIHALEEQGALEAQLRQSQKLEALGTLAGGVAHDFNNLLVVIMSNAELAAEEQVSPAAKQSLKEISEASESAAELTAQLLAFGRRQVAQRVALDAGGRLEHTMGMVRRLMPASIEVSFQLPERQFHILAAPIEFDQVVMNLCVNARDAMTDGGRLRLELRRAARTAPNGGNVADYVCLEVRDDGRGMSEQVLARVFEPFFTTKAAGKGTGLGLSMVHGIVNDAGGFLEVDSELEGGTRIRVYWPAFAGPIEPVSREQGSGQLRGNETVLVVDDDPGVRAVLRRHLQRAGYQVIDCHDGACAIDIYRDRHEEIALIISDAVMPTVGGRELHRRITAEFGEIPFLVCSGYAAETMDASFFEQPARSFLSKPFATHALLYEVRKLIDHGASQARPGRVVREAQPTNG